MAVSNNFTVTIIQNVDNHAFPWNGPAIASIHEQTVFTLNSWCDHQFMLVINFHFVCLIVWSGLDDLYVLVLNWYKVITRAKLCVKIAQNSRIKMKDYM